MARGFRKCETCGSHGHGGHGCPVYRLNQQQERRRKQRRLETSFGLTPELEREIILIRKAWKIAAALGSLLLCATSLFAGTITGRLQTATGGAVTNGTLSFRLSQPAVIVGTASLVTSPASCYISAAGNIVGVPDPLVAPVLTANTISGTLPAGTYFVVVTYAGASGESVASPESTIVLSAQGTLIVQAPVKQPANATGYNVYIGSASGTETLQASVTSFTQYSQTSALAGGAALPSSNSSVCSLAFSDQLIPSGTYYAVNLVNKNGSTIAGFPQTWCTYGGQSGTINVSNGAPTGNCGTNGVIYPTPIVANPANNAPQSIASPLSLGINPFAAGSSTLSSINNILFVDGVKYANIAAVQSAAGSTRTLGIIPSTYPGTECPTVSSTISWWDLRGGVNICVQNSISYNTTSGGGLVSLLRGISTNTGGATVTGYFQNFITNGTGGASTNADGGSLEVDVTGTLTGTFVNVQAAENPAIIASTGGTITNAVGQVGYVNTNLGSTTNITTVKGTWGLGCNSILGSGTIANCYGTYSDEQRNGTARNYALAGFGPNLLGYGSNFNGAALDAEDSSHVTHRFLVVDGSSNTLIQAIGTNGLLLKDSTGATQQKILSTGTTFSTGIGADGSGFKHLRGTTGCTTAASVGAACTTVVTWSTAFADANYTAGCSGDLVTSGIPVNGGLTAKVAASVTFQTVATTAVAAKFTAIDCWSVHD